MTAVESIKTAWTGQAVTDVATPALIGEYWTSTDAAGVSTVWLTSDSYFESKNDSNVFQWINFKCNVTNKLDAI